MLLEEQTGVKPDILRFPGGSNNHISWKAGGRRIMASIAREMSKQGIAYFDWNVSSADAAAVTLDKQSIVQAVKQNSAHKDRIIVLMHDMDKKTTTVEALPEIITFLKREGYEFKGLDKEESFRCQFLQPPA